jgi:hypothetical protein
MQSHGHGGRRLQDQGLCDLRRPLPREHTHGPRGHLVAPPPLPAAQLHSTNPILLHHPKSHVRHAADSPLHSPHAPTHQTVPSFQLWLLVGVVLILGSGSRVYIPLIASGVFTAVIIAVPLICEKLLTPSQRAEVPRLFGSIFGCGPARKEGRAGNQQVLIDSAADVPPPVAVPDPRRRDQQLSGGSARNWDGASSGVVNY